MKNCLEIEHAAELSGELAFLHEVTCDILNVEAHSRYAEWLDDNGEQSARLSCVNCPRRL